MIKTVSYNDFTEINQTQIDNWHEFKQILIDFKTSGGDLTLPLLYDKEKPFTKFIDWFKEIYKDDADFSNKLKELFLAQVIANPVRFIVNQELKTIRHDSDYNLQWMRQNSEQFAPLILEAFAQLVKDIESWDLGLNHFLFGRDLAQRRIMRQLEKDPTRSLAKYFYDDTNGKEVEEIFLHPLMSIIEKLNNLPNRVDLYKILFETSQVQDYTQLFKQYLEDVRYACGIKYSIANDSLDTALYFYDKNINQRAFLYDTDGEHSYDVVHQLITHAIYTNNVDFIERHIYSWDITEIEKSKAPYDSFLNHSISSIELAKLLLENGAIVEADYLGSDQKNTYHYSLFASSKLSLPVLDAIMQTQPQYLEMIQTQPEFFYEAFSNSEHVRNGFSFLRFLTEKYHFPLEKFDVMHMVMNFNNTDNLQWVLESGADPRKCREFIIKVIGQKTDGLRYLKQLQKENIFNTFYPDPLFHILANQKTKEFNSWLDKAPEDIFNRRTIQGMPAWWGANSENMWNVTKNKVTDFTQLSKDGLSWYFYRAKHAFKKDYKTNFRESSMIQEMIKKQPDMMWKLEGMDEQGNNAFHHLFDYKQYGKEEIQNETLALVLAHTQSDIVALMMQENKDGITPLANALDYDTHSNMHSYHEAKRMLILDNLDKFPLTQEIIVHFKHFEQQRTGHTVEQQKMNVAEALSTLFPNQQEHIHYNYLQQKLTTQTHSVKRIKL